MQMPPDCAMLRGKRGIFLMKTALTIAGSDSSGAAGVLLYLLKKLRKEEKA